MKKIFLTTIFVILSLLGFTQAIGITDNVLFVPTSLLHISANTVGSPLFTVDKSGANYFQILNNGNVGIGLNNPSYKLHLYGTSNDASDIYSQTDAGRIIKHWFVNGIQSWSIGQFGTTVAPNGQFRITDETSGNARIIINTDGSIGISNVAPTEKLDITGNLKFSGAIMPGGIAGITGKLLTSAGAGVAPTWTNFTIGNPGATTQIAKYYSSFSWSGTWANNTGLIFTIIDANCRNESCITVAIDGPWNALYSGLTIRNVVCEVGQFQVTVINNSGSGLTGGIPISFIAFY